MRIAEHERWECRSLDFALRAPLGMTTHVIPSERSESRDLHLLVVPSERSAHAVIPSERSESRDLHLLVVPSERSESRDLHPVLASEVPASLMPDPAHMG
jgi:hypothetical protein